MSWILELALTIHNWRNGVTQHKLNTNKTSSPLRLGVLSAAAINPIAIFDPIDSHPDVILAGIAARSKAKAQAQVDKYKLTSAKVYDSYDDLLADASIDAVYIPLPNGLHTSWAIKSLNAGKHALIEKPLTSNAKEVDEIREAASKAGKVAVEAFHWRFHPAAHVVKELTTSGEYGNVLSVATTMKVPDGIIKSDDIRLKYDLAGGASMDLVYAYSAATFFATSDRSKATIKALEAKPRLWSADQKIDAAMLASFEVRENTPSGERIIQCSIDVDFNDSWLLGIIPRIWKPIGSAIITCEKAQIEFINFPMPHGGHKITITPRDNKGDLVRSKSITRSTYAGGPQWGDGKGEKWWTTYRYQLECFVDKVRAVQEGKSIEQAASVQPWVSFEESRYVMGAIDSVYEKAGLPPRGL